MKLSKLYSNKLFRNITFITDKGGLNVIVGDAKGKHKGSNSHSLGKTKLAELLDFMLLKGIGKKANHFFYKGNNKKRFAGCDFFLEILLNDGRYLTIKRTVDTPTRIAFKLNDKTSQEYKLYSDFDNNPPSFDKAKIYLNEILNFDFCKETNESYRRLVNYSLRTQGDYEPKMNTIFQLRKFARNKDKDWKPLIFKLLGFDGGVLLKKYNLEEEIKKRNDTIQAQEKDFGIKTADKDLLVGKIQNVEIEKNDLSQQLENLNFYQQDKDLIHSLVGTIEENIAELNIHLYNIEYDIKKLEDSIRNQFSFNLSKTKRLFEEVELYFPEQLAKSYSELIDFNHQITKERNNQIRQTLKEKKTEERRLDAELIALNKQKKQYSELIQDTSLFKKYSVYQKQLIELERELTRLQTQLEEIEEIERKKEKIEETLKDELDSVKDKLKKIIDHTAKCELYMNIRRIFSAIVKRILNETAIITIKPNSNYNIEFKPEFPNSAQDEGNTYYKILCVAFDLSILINYRHQSHFRFVYHDDVVAGDDNGVKSRLISVVRKICAEYDIQYIFSAVKDNLPPSQDLTQNIILELHDKDDTGKLFKMSF